MSESDLVCDKVVRREVRERCGCKFAADEFGKVAASGLGHNRGNAAHLVLVPVTRLEGLKVQREQAK